MLKDKIKEYRVRSSLSQEKLAEIINVSTNTIQNWESGANKPTTENIITLEAALGLAPKTLLNAYADDIYGISNVQKMPVGDLPVFLLDEKELKEIDSLHFTEDQQELFGLLWLYKTTEYQGTARYDAIDNLYTVNLMDGNKLPYDYVRDKNIFELMNNIDSVNKIVGHWSNPSVLANLIKKNPTRLFDFKTLDMVDVIKEISDRYKDLYVLAVIVGIIKDGLFLGEEDPEYADYKHKNMYVNGVNWDELPKLEVNVENGTYYINYKILFDAEYYYRENFYYIEEIKKYGLFVKTLEEPTDEEYKKTKERYTTLLKIYNESPELYDKKPTLNAKMNGYIKLTDKGIEFREWLRRNKESMSEYAEKYKNKTIDLSWL